MSLRARVELIDRASPAARSIRDALEELRRAAAAAALHLRRLGFSMGLVAADEIHRRNARRALERSRRNTAARRPRRHGR